MYYKYYLIVLCLLISSVSAQTTTTFSGSSGIEDTWLNRGSQTTPYGLADTLLAQNAFASHSTILIKALSITDSIPITATIVACSVRVYCEDISDSKRIWSWRVCKSWSEGIDALSGATHNQAVKGFGAAARDWTTVGAFSEGSPFCDSCDNDGDGTGADRIGDTLSSATFSTTGWVAIPVDTCHANAWLTGADNNNGVQLYDDGYSAFTTVTFTSSEGASNTPEFIFVWTDESGVPNARHSSEGVGVRHSGDGASARHGG